MSNIVDYANKINTEKTVGGAKYGLATVFLSGAGYIDYPFKRISNDSILGWEAPVWSAELSRTLDFKLENIADVEFGLVARLEIAFKYMNAEDYKVFAAISHERVCYATYFNREKGVWIERQEMAFTKQELNKLYAFGKNYYGAMGVTATLVATNRDRAAKTYSIRVRDSDTAQFTSIATVNWGGAFQLSDALLTKSGKIIAGWSAENGTRQYLANALLTVFDDYELTAIWADEPTT